MGVPREFRREVGIVVKIEHNIEIAAPVERVWDLTVDVESLPQHTPTITSVRRMEDGPLRVGSAVRIKQPAQGEKTWTVTRLEPQHHFAWATRFMGMTMTGGHHLEPVPAGTRNTLTLEIDGALAPIVGPLIRGSIRKAITTENEGFKRAAEAGSR
jgi:uncharacterized membrane protein